VLLLIGAVGQGFGAYWLIWHDDRLTQFLNGVALASLVMVCLWGGYLVYLRDWQGDDPPSPADRQPLPFTVYCAAVLFWVAVTLACLWGLSLALDLATSAIRSVITVPEGENSWGRQRYVIAPATQAGVGAAGGEGARPAGITTPAWPGLCGLLLGVGGLCLYHFLFLKFAPCSGEAGPAGGVDAGGASAGVGGGRASQEERLVRYLMAGLILFVFAPTLYTAWALWLNCWSSSPGSFLCLYLVGFFLTTGLLWWLFRYVPSAEAKKARSALMPESWGLLLLVPLLGGLYLLGCGETVCPTPVLAAAVPWLFFLGTFSVAQCWLSRAVLPGLLLLLAELVILGGIPPHPYRIPFRGPPPAIDAEWPYSPGSLVRLWHTRGYGAKKEDPRVIPEDPSAAVASKATGPQSLWDQAAEKDQKRAVEVRKQATEPAPPGSADPDISPLLKTHEIKFTARPSGRAGRGSPRYPEGKPRPLVLLAVSGGGSKAGLWTLAILHRLEEELARDGYNFADHVRVIAGASGGMYGAGAYVTEFISDPATDAPWHRFTDEEFTAYLAGRSRSREALRDAVAADYITPLAGELFFRDLPGMFSPWPRSQDRGRRLEQEWGRRMPGLTLTFDRLAALEKEGRCPSLIFSPMMVEDGRRLLISNLDLRYVASNDGNLVEQQAPPTLRKFSRSARELFRLHPEAASRLSVATAARLSASFPYFTPAVHLPTWPPRRLVDAGYYDNYGISLASSWLFSGHNRAWILGEKESQPAADGRASKVLLVRIRAAKSDEALRMELLERSLPHPFWRGLHQFTTPPEGLAAMRESSMAFRNDEMLELLSQDYDARTKTGTRLGKEPFLHIASFELGLGEAEAVSLNWRLTDREKELILFCAGLIDKDGGVKERPGATDRDAVRKNVDAIIDNIKRWWGKPDPRGP
jgi:hypothetical protein